MYELLKWVELHNEILKFQNFNEINLKAKKSILRLFRTINFNLIKNENDLHIINKFIDLLTKYTTQQNKKNICESVHTVVNSVLNTTRIHFFNCYIPKGLEYQHQINTLQTQINRLQLDNNVIQHINNKQNVDINILTKKVDILIKRTVYDKFAFKEQLKNVSSEQKLEIELFKNNINILTKKVDILRNNNFSLKRTIHDVSTFNTQLKNVSSKQKLEIELSNNDINKLNNNFDAQTEELNSLKNVSLKQKLEIKLLNNDINKLSNNFDAQTEELNSLKKIQQNMQTNYESLCVVCFENEKNILFLPCKHNAVCEKCSILTECPICRHKITDTLKFFLS
jgi:hypothetical protein